MTTHNLACSEKPEN